MRNFFLEIGAKEQADSLDEEEVGIVIKIAEVIERVGKINYQLLEMCQRINY